MEECKHEYHMIDDLPGPLFAMCIFCGDVCPEEGISTGSSNKTIHIFYEDTKVNKR